MQKLTEQTKKIMDGRFGKDNVISLATSAENVPYVRYVNAYYEDGVFYVITYALSNKMKQMEKKRWWQSRATGLLPPVKV